MQYLSFEARFGGCEPGHTDVQTAANEESWRPWLTQAPSVEVEIEWLRQRGEFVCENARGRVLFSLVLLGVAAIFAVVGYLLDYYVIAYGAGLGGVGYLFYGLYRWLYLKRLVRQLDEIF